VKSVPVSIIMPFYSSEIYIQKAIQSILEQTYENFELFIAEMTVMIVQER